MILTTEQYVKLQREYNEFDKNYSASEKLIQNYLGKLKKDNPHAKDLLDYLDQLKSVLSMHYDYKIFEKQAENIELKKTLLMDFFKSINFSNIDSNENTLLSGYFHGLNDLFSSYKTLEMKNLKVLQQKEQDAINEQKLGSDELFNRITEECQKFKDIKIDDENTPKSLDNNIGNAIEKMESIIEEDNRKAEEFKQNYFLGLEDGEEKLKQKYFSMQADIKEQQKALENNDSIKSKEDEIQILNEYINSKEFKAYAEKNTSELEDLRTEYTDSRKKYEKAYKDVHNLENDRKLEEYNKYYNAYISIAPDTIQRIREYLKLQKLNEEVMTIINQGNDSHPISKELLAFKEKNKLIPSDIPEYIIKEQQKLIEGHGEEFKKYRECVEYMTNPESEQFFIHYHELKENLRKLDDEYAKRLGEFARKRDEVIADKRKFASKIPLKLSGDVDDAMDKVSYSEIADMYKSTVSKLQNEVTAIYEGETYKQAKENIEKAKIDAEKYNPDKHIQSFKAFVAESKSHIEIKQEYEKLRQRLSTQRNRKAGLDRKQENLNLQGEKLTENFAEKDIARLLCDYDAAIDNNARGAITLDNDKSELKENYLKTNSSEFVSMRLALRKAKDMFAKESTASKQDKLNYLEALKDFAKEYVKVREAESRPFATATRKYRIAFAKELARFAESAFNDMVEEERPVKLEEPAVKQKENPEQLVNNIKEKKPEISADQLYNDQKQQILKKFEENEKKKLVNTIDKYLREIIPDDAKEIGMKDGKLIISCNNNKEKSVSQAIFATYIALKSVKIDIEQGLANHLSVLSNPKDLQFFADSIQGSKAFTEKMLEMDADSKGNNFMFKDRNFVDLTDRLASDCIKESYAVKTKDDYIQSIARRMNNILPKTFSGKIQLSEDSIAKYIYLGTLARAAKNFTTQQLGALLSDEEMEKQVEYIKEKPKFNTMMEIRPDDPHTKNGVGHAYLNAAISSYTDGLLSFGAKKHLDEITSQIESLSKQQDMNKKVMVKA